MRYLITTATLLFCATTVSAGAFLDRFNALEQSMETMQNEITSLKGSGASGTKSASDKGTKVDSEDLKTLKETIELLKAEQERLKKTLELKGTAGGKTAAVKEDIAGDASEADIDPDEIQEQFDEISKSLSTIKVFTAGNHLKMDVDFRTSVDSIEYEMADGSTVKNKALLANRLWINMGYKANANMSFKAQLAYKKLYGARSGTGNYSSFDQFDWVTNESASDDTVRVKHAFYFYQNDTFLGTQVPWTFSIGRRPSTNGHIANLREDDHEASPLGHSINVEFDGLSSKFDLYKVAGVSGLYLKFCMGRGQSNAMEQFASTPYATNERDRENIDLAGLIVSLFDNKQYSLITQYYKAWNLIDLNSTYNGFESVGDMQSFTAQFMINGIGNDNGDFWDDTIFFLSYSTMLTDPKNSATMLGSSERERGYSFWTGVQTPFFTDKGKFGLEYNHGTRYWRSMTYGEDTMIGSKLATRGDAYEVYWTEPFAEDSMSFQIRYTYLDYKYAGSNGFFGSTTGTAMNVDDAVANGYGSSVVKHASDLRMYLRYRY